MGEIVFGLDIREKIFSPFLDEIQKQIIKCMEAVDKNFVKGGSISAKIGIEVEKEKKRILIRCEDKEEFKEIEYKRPVINFTTDLTLSRKDSEKGSLQIPEAELLNLNGQYVLKELERRQMSIDDIEGLWTEDGEKLYEK